MSSESSSQSASCIVASNFVEQGVADPSVAEHMLKVEDYLFENPCTDRIMSRQSIEKTNNTSDI